MKIVKLLYNQADKLGLYKGENTARPVKKLPKDFRKRGILSMNEAQNLLAPDTRREIWQENERGFLASGVASITGCRNGEIRALKKDVLKDRIISIKFSVIRTSAKLKGTKTQDERTFPLPPILAEGLSKLAQQATKAPYYLFSFDNGATPVGPSYFLDQLKRALGRIGISENVRKERYLGFHSWKHFVVTNMIRKGYTVEQIMLTTGHLSKDMIRRQYAQKMVDEFSKFKGFQNNLLEGGDQRKTTDD